jgi:hypothetical protein
VAGPAAAAGAELDPAPRRDLRVLECDLLCSERPIIFPSRGLDPRVHVLAVVTGCGQDVDGHGSSPWAEGPRAEPGQDD